MPVLSSLNVHRRDCGVRTTITLVGEIDLHEAPALHMMVGDCLREGIRTIDIDLTALAFCDVSGLNAFLAAAERTASAGGVLRLTHPRPQVVRLLELSGAGFLRGRVSPDFVPRGRRATRTADLMAGPEAAPRELRGFDGGGG